MVNTVNTMSRLIFELSKLPGIGEKTATRLAYHIVKQDPSYANSLAAAIQNARAKTTLCDTCYTLTDEARCSICQDQGRDQTLVCVVERPSDLRAIESSGGFKGVYHVLHGALSPLDGIGPDELKIRELLTRIEASTLQNREIILAMNPSVEGEATAIYLSKLLRTLGVRVSKLASGIPVGGMLEYSDRQTIGRAIENRREVFA